MSSTKGRKPHPQDLINLAKGSRHSPWRGQRVCETEHAKELEKVYLDRMCKRWGKE
jgi:hypothetical protein